MKLKIYYRISDAGYSKSKPWYINNENCLKNFVSVFKPMANELCIYADNTSDYTDNMIKKVSGLNPIKISQGSSGHSFRYVFEKAISENTDDTVIYFMENDYVHASNARQILEEGISIGAHYVTLYDHPDKYLDKVDGGNPEIEGKGEITQVFKSNSCHWKLTNSTTMTFASTVENLKEDSYIIKKHTSTKYPTDYTMCVELRAMGKTLLSPIPGYSTHGEIDWLCPIVDWENVMKQTIKE